MFKNANIVTKAQQHEVALKTSNKRKLHERMVALYPESGALFTPKDDIIVATAQKIKIYRKGVDPILIEDETNVTPATGSRRSGSPEAPLIPTLYALWKCPEMVKSLYIHPATFSYLENGASKNKQTNKQTTNTLSTDVTVVFH